MSAVLIKQDEPTIYMLGIPAKNVPINQSC